MLSDSSLHDFEFQMNLKFCFCHQFDPIPNISWFPLISCFSLSFLQTLVQDATTNQKHVQ